MTAVPGLEDLTVFRVEAADGVAGLPYTFTLAVQLANPNAPKDEDGDGVPDAVPPVDAMPAVTPVSAPAAVPAADATAPAAEAPTPAPVAAPTQGAES